MTGGDLKRARLDAGLSQRELARQAGTDHKTIQYWEAKPRLDPFSWGIRKMAPVLGWRISPGHYAGARVGVIGTDGVIEAIEAQLSGGYRKDALKEVSRKREICGAKTRKGTPCRLMSEPGKRRCKFHGGKSTGPKTEEGRRRIAEAQRRRWSKC